jgi:hypothetical protein
MSDPVLEWVFNPWRERRARAWIAVAAIAAVSALVSTTGLPLIVRVALCAGFGAALGPAFLPCRYRLDEQGVSLGLSVLAQRRPWSEFRRAVRTQSGVLLSPFATRHWLDGYRAWFVPRPHDRDPAFDPTLEHLLGDHGL